MLRSIVINQLLLICQLRLHTDKQAMLHDAHTASSNRCKLMCKSMNPGTTICTPYISLRFHKIPNQVAQNGIRVVRIVLVAAEVHLSSHHITSSLLVRLLAIKLFPRMDRLSGPRITSPKGERDIAHEIGRRRSYILRTMMNHASELRVRSTAP
jgi:hypothetical protein